MNLNSVEPESKVEVGIESERGVKSLGKYSDAVGVQFPFPILSEFQSRISLLLPLQHICISTAVGRLIVSMAVAAILQCNKPE